MILSDTIDRNSTSFSRSQMVTKKFWHLILGRDGPYIVKEHCDSNSNNTKEDIISMLEFLDNIFVVLGGGSFPTDSLHSNGKKLCPS